MDAAAWDLKAKYCLPKRFIKIPGFNASFFNKKRVIKNNQE